MGGALVLRTSYDEDTKDRRGWTPRNNRPEEELACSAYFFFFFLKNMIATRPVSAPGPLQAPSLRVLVPFNKIAKVTPVKKWADQEAPTYTLIDAASVRGHRVSALRRHEPEGYAFPRKSSLPDWPQPVKHNHMRRQPILFFFFPTPAESRSCRF